MKANSALFLIILSLFILSACAPAEPFTEETLNVNLPNTVVPGAEKLEEDDTVKLKDGLTEDEAESAGYVVVSDLNTKFNKQAYDRFISDIIAGKEAFVRTVYFRDGELVSYVDVTSKDGVFTVTEYDINDVVPGRIRVNTYEKFLTAKKYYSTSEYDKLRKEGKTLEYLGYFYLVNGDMKYSEIETLFSPYSDGVDAEKRRESVYSVYSDRFPVSSRELEVVNNTAAAEKAFDNFYENGRYTYAESIYYPAK